jgi:hypothetical protein
MNEGTHLDPKDKKKTNWELAVEIEELKKRKNKDLEDIKLLKVEMAKIYALHKRYKEMAALTPVLANFNVAEELPFSLSGQAEAQEVASWLSTEELLIETAKIKSLL